MEILHNWLFNLFLDAFSCFRRILFHLWNFLLFLLFLIFWFLGTWYYFLFALVLQCFMIIDIAMIIFFKSSMVASSFFRWNNAFIFFFSCGFCWICEKNSCLEECQFDLLQAMHEGNLKETLRFQICEEFLRRFQYVFVVSVLNRQVLAD